MSNYPNHTQRGSRKPRYPFHWVWQNTVCLILVVLLIGGGTFGILRYFTEYAEALPDAPTQQAVITMSPTPSTPSPTPSVTGTITDPVNTPTPVPTPTPNPIRDIPLLRDGEVIQNYESYDQDDLHVRIQKQHAYESDVYIAEIYFENIEHIEGVFAQGKFGYGYLEKPSAMVERSGVFFAVSGDYYGFHQDGIVVRNGTLYRNNPSDRELCCMFRDGSMRIVPEKQADVDGMMAEGLYHAFTFGPPLIKDGKVCEEFKTDVKKDNPRCGIGWIENGHIVLVVVDGRRDNSKGVSISNFANLMDDLGCKQAYNLDGGATALMIYKGEVISNPSGNFERKMSDVIGLK